MPSLSTKSAPSAPTALIGDPDAALRESIAALLTRAGHCVLGYAEAQEELLALQRRLTPQLIIFGTTGTDQSALDGVRELRRRDQPALVLLAPVSTMSWVRAARAAGVDALLGRPPRECDLLAAVETSLDRRAEVLRLQKRNAELQERLETFSVVARAREVLVRRNGIADDEAERRLARQAQRTGRTLRAVAEAIILAETVAPTTA
jgi:AmiR/NasT family two-component response regulator